LAIASQYPCAIRYPKGSPEQVQEKQDSFKIGQAEVLCEGKDATILALGKMVYPAIQVAKNLKNYKIGVVNVRFVKPLDEELILTLTKKTKKIITIEDHVVNSGFGSAILELLNANQIKDVMVKCLGFPAEFIEHGNTAILFKKYGLDVEGITHAIEEFLR
jgi:1-deoxy-D-xylulose-5-phosphate synthase